MRGILKFKVIVLIITGFICSNKEVKQVVLINHNCILILFSTMIELQKMVGVLFILPKIGGRRGWGGGGGKFFPKNGGGKIAGGGC